MLVLRNLTVCFQTRPENIYAVEGIDLSVDQNDKIAIIGETGSGKSVLLLAIVKLLSASAQISGNIIFDGTSILSLPIKQIVKLRGNEIAYIPQGSGVGLNPLLTVGQQVAEPQIIHRKVNKALAYSQAVMLLEKFNFVNALKWASMFPFQYSGGMKQRALIAMGLSLKPRLLLADEPTKGLDSVRRDEVLEAIQKLTDVAVLCVTHDLVFARQCSEKIIVMYAAEIIEESSNEAFFSSPLHPYSQALIQAMPGNGMKSLYGYAPLHDTNKNIGCRFQKRCNKAYQKCYQKPPMIQYNNRRVRCWLYAPSGEKN